MVSGRYTQYNEDPRTKFQGVRFASSECSETMSQTVASMHSAVYFFTMGKYNWLVVLPNWPGS